jgi:hypothetical protein
LESQRPGFLLAQLEHKILGEAVEIALDGLVDIEGFHLAEPGEAAIEHDLLAADEVDAPFDDFHRNGRW